jgi:hypothetical protein
VRVSRRDAMDVEPLPLPADPAPADA